MTNEKPFTNQELNIAQEYLNFGKQIESFDVEFSLTFTSFKQLWVRKHDMLTKRQLVSKGIFVLDKTKAVTKDNCLVVEKELQESLDNLMAKSKLGLKELQSLCKVLIGKI